MLFLVATDVIARQLPERWQTGMPHARAKRKEKNVVFSGHYVIASSWPPERRPLERRTLVPIICSYVHQFISYSTDPKINRIITSSFNLNEIILA